MKTLRFVGIAGSLRNDSASRALLNSISEMLPEQSHFTALDIGAMEHYCQDLEKGELPESVATARRLVAEADAAIVTVPEYNHGMPGVLKNALDWLSRPVRASCMMDKYVFFVSQSTGALGGVRAQYQLRETLASMLCNMVPLPEMAVSFANQKTENGRLTDPVTAEYIRRQLNVFIKVVEQNSTNR
ncbi:NADPH-dependent FMN reductase [Cedecea sp. P7760]|jgi:chromate reductase|uniref:NADPH-dependent FMN reductase n=1 Tax=Cedecea TaxID=158483 RepID=UPI0015A1DE29|nr:NADPH-dependent FMN reductase [Cedecea sp. P7760]NWC66007.1 NAD(P)H-dependent oxidoreductase [Cedecea sp. P7760]